MMLDISHAESAFSAGTTTYDEWFARQDEQWNRPIIRTQLAVFLSTLSDEQKAIYAPQINQIKDRLGLKEKEDHATKQIPWTGEPGIQPEQAGLQPLPGTGPAEPANTQLPGTPGPFEIP